MQEISTETPTFTVITGTLLPTLTPPPSETPLPPPPQPMAPRATPLEGTTSTQINVRAEPSTASKVLGILPVNTKVEIIGKDAGGNWWQINYPQGMEGKAWVAAKYVKTARQPEVQVIGGDESNPNAGNSAVVIQQLNIRSGPGTNFNSLGILNANDVIHLTGKSNNGSWLQIAFANGPDGKGWVNAAFVKTDNVDGLPIISDSGAVIGTGTPMNTPLPPTPTIVPASMDNDSTDSPIKTITLDADTRTVLYNGDVSAPGGDTEDWIAVTSYTNMLFIGIQCFGNGSIQTEIIGTAFNIPCNDAIKVIPVQANTRFLIHVMATVSSSQLQYTNYILTIKANP